MSIVARDVPDQTPDRSETAVRFTDLLPLVDTDQLVEHVETLHRGAAGAVCLVRMVANAGDRGAAHVWSELSPDAQPFSDVDRAIWEQCIAYGAERWHFYVATATFNRPTEQTREGKQRWYARQSKYVNGVAGFFADLDVKSGVAGHFQTRAELDRFLEKLPQPSLLVDTGSGGAHPYWLTTERLPGGREGAKLLAGWHDFMQERAGGTTLDNVSEPARILRLAGTVRWSKRSEIDAGWPTFTRVVLRYANGPRYPLEELAELCRPALQRGDERRRAIREEFNAARERSIADLERAGLERTSQEYIERRFNAEQDWGALLERAEWTLAADGRDGSGHANACRYWRRPGLSAEAHGSASTDWGESQLMTLYSNEPAVAALADPNVPTTRFRSTTKYRFALVALYGGDERALVLDIHRGGGTLA
jgi:hypothetical protein